MTRVLGDEDVLAAIRPRGVVELMRDAVVAAHRGVLVAPARHWIELGSTSFGVTAGAHAGGAGFRVYGTWGPGSDQLTAVWDAGGRLTGLVLGGALGSVRTGALGGVAMDALARPDAERLAVIGSGTVAWWQVWAALAVRPFTQVVVHSRDATRRAGFAARIEREFDTSAVAVETAREAVSTADAVIVSTTSREPVLEADWLAPGTHVNSTGPKFLGGSELPVELASAADTLVSDSPQQALHDREPWFAERAPDHLGAVLDDAIPGRRTPEDRTLYCSTGLAGTEVLLAEAVLLGQPFD